MREHIGPAGPTDEQIETQDGGDPREPIYDVDNLLPEAPPTPEFEEAVLKATSEGYEAVLALVKGVDHNARNWGYAHAQETLKSEHALALSTMEGKITRLGALVREANEGTIKATSILGGSIQPEWAMALPIQMQSVLLLSTRGADGVPKHHPSKHLIRMYRACVIKAAAARRMLVPGENVYDTFMDPRSLADSSLFERAVDEYFSVVDELPFHYHLHLVHAAEILGYKHPDARVRAMWRGFYLKAVDDMHLSVETEEQLDHRLNDFGKVDPTSIPSPGIEAPVKGILMEEAAVLPEDAPRPQSFAQMESPGTGYADPSEGHDHPSEAACFEGCRGYAAVQAQKAEASEVPQAILAQMKARVQKVTTVLPQVLDVTSRALPVTEEGPTGISSEAVQVAAPAQNQVIACGVKQGGSNSPCIKPKGHTAPHNDGNYVW